MIWFAISTASSLVRCVLAWRVSIFAGYLAILNVWNRIGGRIKKQGAETWWCLLWKLL